MQIIPVIDIKDQLVVHAQQGNRAQYRPINSLLCPHAELTVVIEAYLSLYPFAVFYIADLDAIAEKNLNQALIKNTLQRYRNITFWIDSGYQATSCLYQEHSNYLPVLGSESYNDTNYLNLANFKQNFILSLDFAADVCLGATAIFKQAALWPEKIIIMNLRQVGSNAGPDFSKLTDFQQRYPKHHFIAAGGVRNFEDLMQLQQHKITTALIASALHSGSLSAQELLKLAEE